MIYLMDRYKTFFFLFFLLSMLFSVLIMSSLRDSTTLETTTVTSSQKELEKISTIGIEQWKELYDTRDFVVIDIRTFQEFNLGHIKNSTLVDFYASDFSSQLDQLDKKKKYLIYCRSGSRSSYALSQFKQLGFQEVYDLQGGVLSWKEEGYGLVT